MAPRDPKDPMAGLIRRTLAHDAAEGDHCLEPGSLAAYFERSLDKDEAARCELHLSNCARCREQLAVLARASESLITDKEKEGQAAGWAGFWNWRILAPALAVLVVAAGIWFFQRAERMRVASSESERQVVAMNQTAQSAPVTAASAPSAIPPESLMAAKPKVSEAEKSRELAEQESELRSREEISSNLERSDRSTAAIDALRKLQEEPAGGAVAGARGGSTQAGASGTPSAAAAPPLQQTVEVQPSTPPAAPPTPVADLVAPSTQQVETKGKVVVAGAISGVAQTEAKANKVTETAQPAKTALYSSSAGVTYTVQAIEGSGVGTLIHTPDPKTIWRLAEAGFVERSVNGGATWQGQLVNANAHFTAGSAPTVRVCWLVGDGGVILLTRNARDWKTVSPPVTADFVSIEATDASTAVVTAADGQRFTTTDTGKTWTKVH